VTLRTPERPLDGFDDKADAGENDGRRRARATKKIGAFTIYAAECGLYVTMGCITCRLDSQAACVRLPPTCRCRRHVLSRTDESAGIARRKCGSRAGIVRFRKTPQSLPWMLAAATTTATARFDPSFTPKRHRRNGKIHDGPKSFMRRSIDRF
jgi:hypothetical protein